MTQARTEVVVVSLQELVNAEFDFEEAILKAFGADGLGVIAIRGIPNWETLVRDTLPLAHELQALPQEVLNSLEHAESLYGAGWSFGREKFGDKPDTKKASFYFNPLSNDPRPPTRKEYPWILPANLWPSKEIPTLEEKCRELGSVMHSVVVTLAKRIDALNLGAKLAEEMDTSLMSTGRMLYYYPLKEDELQEVASRPDGWIGWHNDSGFLTALTPDIYFEHSTGNVVSNPEPETAGLWIAARDGVLHRVSIPSDCMAVQCGESVQIVTGGKLVATPHCVRPPVKTTNISRASMPVFVGVSASFPMSSPGSTEEVFINTVKQWVPPLADRWTGKQNYAEFLGDSFKAYYGWSNK